MMKSRFFGKLALVALVSMGLCLVSGSADSARHEDAKDGSVALTVANLQGIFALDLDAIDRTVYQPIIDGVEFTSEIEVITGNTLTVIRTFINGTVQAFSAVFTIVDEDTIRVQANLPGGPGQAADLTARLSKKGNKLTIIDVHGVVFTYNKIEFSPPACDCGDDSDSD